MHSATVQNVILSDPCGSPTSKRSSGHWTPRVRSAPHTTPTALAPTPIPRPSKMRERRTCAGVPPTARMRASSRKRWVTTTEKVLKMTNAATNIDR